MRRFSATFGKNLKLLFRSRETAFTVIFGPILIILLVGFAFMGSSDDLAIRVGVHAAADDVFAERTIAALGDDGFMVNVYGSKEQCAQSVKDGAAHACIAFTTADAAGTGAADDNRPHATIYLDPSRINLVDRIATTLSKVIDVQSDSLRLAMASDAITRIGTARGLIASDINTTDAMLSRLASVSANLSVAKRSLENIADTPVNISLKGVRGMQLGLAQKVGIAVETGNDAISDAVDMIRELERDCEECANGTIDAAKELRESLELVQDNLTRLSEEQTAAQLRDADYLLDVAMDDIDALTARLAQDSAARKTIAASVAASADDASDALSDLRKVDASLRYTHDLLAGQRTDAASMTMPISVSVSNVASTDDRSTFTYPYLFVMVMMFMGLLLASTLVVVDKTSRARFRNFTTPTSDGYHVFVSFVTAFAILVVEAIAILLVSAVIMAQQFLVGTLAMMTIVCVSIVIFTFIGMIIGYLSRTQEAAMIASISVGSVLLFVSNLLIPIEGMASATQVISGLNPYLVLSELLKKSMLFGVSAAQVVHDLTPIFVLAIVLLALTILVQRRNRRKYFRQDGGLLAPHIPSPLLIAGKHVNNEVELLDCLDHMTRAEFDSVVKTDDNLIAAWVKTELRNRSLSRQLRTTSKEKMMLKLDKYLARHGKHMKR
ncbi:TPA: ABC transporter permease [Candidatus Woesearchaeota archaeon]|nr:ABC transporter permease [Candidatus Woesearchaeota archaeon]